MYLIPSWGEGSLTLTPRKNRPLFCFHAFPDVLSTRQHLPRKALGGGWARDMTPCASTLCCLVLTPHHLPSSIRPKQSFLPLPDLTIVFFAECNSPMAQDPDIVLPKSLVPSLYSWSLYLCHSARTNQSTCLPRELAHAHHHALSGPCWFRRYSMPPTDILPWCLWVDLDHVCDHQLTTV